MSTKTENTQILATRDIARRIGMPNSYEDFRILTRDLGDNIRRNTEQKTPNVHLPAVVKKISQMEFSERLEIWANQILNFSIAIGMLKKKEYKTFSETEIQKTIEFDPTKLRQRQFHKTLAFLVDMNLYLNKIIQLEHLDTKLDKIMNLVKPTKAQIKKKELACYPVLTHKKITVYKREPEEELPKNK